LRSRACESTLLARKQSEKKKKRRRLLSRKEEGTLSKIIPWKIARKGRLTQQAEIGKTPTGVYRSAVARENESTRRKDTNVVTAGYREPQCGSREPYRRDSRGSPRLALAPLSPDG